MPSTLQLLRAQLAASLADRSHAGLARLRGAATEQGTREEERRQFFLTDRVLEALAEVEERSELPQANLRALKAHVALTRADYGREAHLIKELAALGRPSGQPPALPAVRLERTLAIGDERTRARELQSLLSSLRAQHGGTPLGLSTLPADEPKQGEDTEHLGRLLEITEAPLAEYMEYEGRRYGGRGAPRLDTLLCVLRARPFDGLFKPVSRLRRAASPLRELGFERIMGQRLRAELDGCRLVCLPDVWCAGQGADLRVVHPSIGGGPLVELSTTQAIAHAFSCAVASAELPVELRAPLPDHVGQAFGGLFAQALLEPSYLGRYYGLSGRDQADVRRALLVSYLVSLRVHITLTEAARGAPGQDAPWSALRSAFTLPCEPETLSLFLGATGPMAPRLSGMLVGLRLHIGARERFDEDYFRNPRFAELWVSACSPGNGLSITDLEEQLELDPGWAEQRLCELF